MILEDQIGLEIAKAEGQLKEFQARFQAETAILQTRLAALKAAQKALKKGNDVETAVGALVDVGILKENR